MSGRWFGKCGSSERSSGVFPENVIKRRTSFCLSKWWNISLAHIFLFDSVRPAPPLTSDQRAGKNRQHTYTEYLRVTPAKFRCNHKTGNHGTRWKLKGKRGRIIITTTSTSSLHYSELQKRGATMIERTYRFDHPEISVKSLDGVHEARRQPQRVHRRY